MPNDSVIHYETFSNGFTLVAEPMPEVRSAAFAFLVPVGAVNDPESLPGAAMVLEGMMYRGAGSRDNRALSDALDALGIDRGGGTDVEFTSFKGLLLGEDLDAALGLYRDILREPRLPSEELETEKSLALQTLESLEDKPMEKVFLELRRIYYGPVWGRSALGTREGIAVLTHDHIGKEHRRRYAPKGAILAVAGRLDWNRLRATAQSLFGDWKGNGAPANSLPANGTPSYTHLLKETSQVQIGVAWPGVPLGHKDYYDHVMALRVLSGGMGARLFAEVREKRGLVYSVSAGARVMKGVGSVFAYAGTTPDRAEETLAVLLREVVKLGEGVTEAEVERARTGVLSSLVMQGESSGARAGGVAADYHLLGRARTLEEIRDAVNRVTARSIGGALALHAPKDFCVVTMGPQPVPMPM